MTPLAAALRRAATILRDERLGWAVVGGLLVSVRCEPRTTRDIDVAVAVPADEEIEVYPGLSRPVARTFRFDGTWGSLEGR